MAWTDSPVTQYLNREEIIEINIVNMFNLVLGQCTRPLKVTLEAHIEWNQVSRDDDYIELLKMMKSIVVYNFQSQKKIFVPFLNPRGVFIPIIGPSLHLRTSIMRLSKIMSG